MTASRDPDRLIHHFILEGEEQLQDQVYDAVRAEIEQTRQRAMFGPWRMPNMNKLVPIGLGAAAVVVALVIGAQLLGSPEPGGFGAPPSTEPSATLEPSASAEPSVAEPSSPADGSLPEGPFRIVDSATEVPITVTIPAPGWISLPEFGGLSKGEDADPPEAALLAWSWPAGTPFYVYGDPCQWASTKPDTPATTVDEIVAALAAQASRAASTPVDVTVGGYPGKMLTLHVPNDAPTRDEAFAGCDQNEFGSYEAGDSGRGGPSRTHQGPGQVDEFWILDVDGAIVIIDAMYRPSTPAELVEELRAIAESATFGN